MSLFWKYGAMTTSEVRQLFPEPRPHINTVSTRIQMLESNGYLSHRKEGRGYRYFHVVKPLDYISGFGISVARSCSGNPWVGMIRSFIEDDKISTDDIRELIERIVKNKI